MTTPRPSHHDPREIGTLTEPQGQVYTSEQAVRRRDQIVGFSIVATAAMLGCCLGSVLCAVGTRIIQL